jgi:hypothetical protein
MAGGKMIKDHQDLLDRYVGTELHRIADVSGDISGDSLKLKAEVEDYAQREGLIVNNTDWEPYFI